MPDFSITRTDQMGNVLVRHDSDGREPTVAIISNIPPQGWTAFRCGADRRPMGDGINVNRLINQHDGAERIAAALGLK